MLAKARTLRHTFKNLFCFQGSVKRLAPSPPPVEEIVFSMSATQMRHHLQRRKSDKRVSDKRESADIKSKLNIFEQL